MLRICLLASGLLFIALAIGVYVGEFAHPINWDLKWHGGKSRGQWLIVLHEGTPEERQQAVEAMVAFGPAVMPELIQSLREGDGPTRELAMTALARIGEPSLEPLRKACVEPQWISHRSRFQSALVKLGPQFAPAVVGWVDSSSVFDHRLAVALLCEWRIGPELVLPRIDQLLAHDEIAEDVIRLLATIGKEGVLPLAKMVGHGRADVRAAALVALGEMKADANAAVPLLQEQRARCNDDDRALIEKTIQAIQAEPASGAVDRK